MTVQPNWLFACAGLTPEGGMDAGGRLAAPLVAATPRHQWLCCSVLGVCSVQSGAPTVGRTHQTPLLLPDTNMLHRERPFWTASNAMQQQAHWNVGYLAYSLVAPPSISSIMGFQSSESTSLKFNFHHQT